MVADLRDCGVTSFAMELVPRISRAQSMDALSSQALVAGYRCAIVAAGMLRRFFPLNMTAAGTVPAGRRWWCSAPASPACRRSPPRKRLGAVVKAYDVRAAAAEEIRSMGAQAIELELETLEGAGGYAREMTEDRAARQRDLLDAVHRGGRRADHHRRRARPAGADAGDPRDGRADEARLGRGRPRRRDRRQRRGLRGRRGGPDRQRRRCGAAATCRRQMPGPASRLYAQNIVNLVTLMTATATEDQAPRVRARLRRRDRRRGRASTHDGVDPARDRPATALEGEQA